MELKEMVSQALIDSTVEVFSSVLSTVPTVSEGKLDVGGSSGKKIIASIGLVGTLEGSLVLIFSDEAACKIVSKMLCDEIPAVNQDVLDGAGEVANMLAGGSKSRIAGSGYTFEVSIPSVIQGGDPVVIAKIGESEHVTLLADCGDFKFDLVFSYMAGGKSAAFAEKAKAAHEQAAQDAASALGDMFK